MASPSENSLTMAINAVERALARLDAAADVALQDREASAAARETVQAEISHSWQQHSAELEGVLANAQSENAFLKADNLRLTNQLQALQRDYLALQKIAGEAAGRLDATVQQLDLILEQ